MESLPNELLDKIIDYCDYASLKALRLVNRRLRDLCDPEVFDHFFLGTFDDGLQHLCSVANSHLAKHVKRFTFYPDTLPDWTEGEWKLTARFHHHSASRKDLTDDDLRPRWLEFERLREEQYAWSYQVEGLVLQKHFAMLPNVEEVSIIAATVRNGLNKKWPLWKRLRTRLLIGPEDQPLQHYPRSNMSNYTSGSASLCMLEAIGYRTSFPNTKNITNLAWHTGHFGPYADFMGRDGDGAPLGPLAVELRLQRIRQSFEHLTSLDLVSFYSNDGVSRGGEVATLLRSARQVRKLTLAYDLNRCSPYVSGQDALGQLLTSQPWPHLKDVFLSMNVAHGYLARFLDASLSNITTLELRHMQVGDAQALFERIAKTMNLDNVRMKCLLHMDSESSEIVSCVLPHGIDADKPYERALKAYLLRQSSELPELKFERPRGMDETEY